MGKRIIQRARGKGGPPYKSPGHRFAGKIAYPQEGSAQVIDIINDPARSSPLARLKLPSGREVLVIAAEGIRVGENFTFGTPRNGNIMRMKNVPKGAYAFALETFPGSGPKLCCASGTRATVVTQEPNKVILQMPSKVFKTFNPECLATMGIPAGSGRKDKPFITAGQKYHAKRARNKLWPRASACKMNAVDHPFGGRTQPGTPKSSARRAPPGGKIGSFASSRSGKRKK